jgi:integrase/recombinase XerD
MDKAVFDDWILWGRRARGWAERTAVNYRGRVEGVTRWLAGRGVKLLDASTRDLDHYLLRCEAPSTRNGYVQALRAFYVWAVREGLCTVNPAADLERVQPPEALPQALTGREATAVLGAAKAEGPMWVCYVTLLFYGGLRRDEARTLRWGDVRDGWLHIHAAKGGKGRTVPIHGKAERALAEWRAVCPSPRWVFPSPMLPQPVSDTTVKVRLRRIGVRAQVALRSHLGRHSFATRLVEQGVDIRAVQRLLGHAELKSTSRYLTTRDHQLVTAVLALDYAAAS